MYFKKCCTCKETKPETEFYKDRSRGDGLAGQCKQCKKEYDSKESVRQRKRKFTENWRSNNWDYVKNYVNTRYHTNPKVKISACVSASLSYSLRRNGLSKQCKHWEHILGYTGEELMHHLESQFQPGMTWDNYGEVWEIDHIIPIAVFEFKDIDDEDFKKCWMLKNLRPLWKLENQQKQDKIILLVDDIV